MTKEEEAIKKLEYYLQNSAYKRVDSDFFENNWELVSLEIPQAIETVLSMLKENSRENIQLKKQIDLMAEDWFSKEGYKLQIYTQRNRTDDRIFRKKRIYNQSI